MGAPGQQPGSDSDRRIGTVFERCYRLDAVLGAGGLGAVYRAQHLRAGPQRCIAQRGTHEELMSSSGAYARQFEAQAGGYREPTGDSR